MRFQQRIRGLGTEWWGGGGMGEGSTATFPAGPSLVLL